MNELVKINNDIPSYQKLINLYHDNKDKDFEIITVQLKGFFAANMSAALGGVLDLITENINDILIEAQTDTETILQKNAFLSYFGRQKINDSNNTTIRYQKLEPHDGKFFSNYVKDELLNRTELPSMSSLLKDKMAEKIHEIFVNAQMHSETKHIYTCGQFYPTKHKIEFTIVDMGIGFKQKVNSRFNSNLNSVQAIKWAVIDGNTTKSIPGGIGLALLKEFIGLNNGKMQIISDNGFYEYSNEGERNYHFNKPFPGTIVNLQFRTDDTSSYILQSELTVDDLF